MTLASVCTHILFSIFLTGTDMVAADGLSSVLSHLLSSAGQNNKPVVLVMDKNNVREEQKYPLKPNNLVEASLEAEEDVPQGVYLIESQVPLSPPQQPQSQKRVPPVNTLAALSSLGDLGSLNLGSLNLGSLDGLYKVPVNRPRNHHKPKIQKTQLTGSGRTTSSPLQKLLRQSECDANDSCVEKCKNRFEGKQQIKCKTKCEVTYECPPVPFENEDYDDPCEDAYNDYC